MTIEFTTLTEQEIDEFLTQPRHAVIGTNRRDGAPQLSPVWYLYREGKFYVSLYVHSAKFLNLNRDPRVTVCVDGAHPDARFVTVYGTADFTREASPWREEIERAIALRYSKNPEDAEQYLSSADDPDSALMIITPSKVISLDYN
jgi:PPOX class probable F420-dependent enzyme